MSSIGVNPQKDHLRFVAGKGYQVQVWVPEDLRQQVAELAGKSKPVAQLTKYLDKTLPQPTRDASGKLVYPVAALRAAAPFDTQFMGWIEQARLGREVQVFDLRGDQREMVIGNYWHAGMTNRRMISLPISTPGLVRLSDGVYVIDHDSSPTTSPMIDVTPAKMLDLDQAIKDWKAVHAKNYGPWRNPEAEKKAADAKHRAAESLFVYMETRNFGAMMGKTARLQEWNDALEPGQAYYYGNDVKALFSALYQKNRFGENKANPGDKLFIPPKPKGDDRVPFLPEDAAKILMDARSQEPTVRWGEWCAAYCGFITSEMFEAKASEITVIDGVPVWDCRGRILKSIYRPRVEPLHSALLDEGLLDYAASRGDGMLFDDNPTRASTKLMAHIRSLNIVGRQYVHYSWRHDFCSQLDRHPDKVSTAMGNLLTGHATQTVKEKNYITKYIHEMKAIIELIGYPLVDKLAEAA